MHRSDVVEAVIVVVAWMLVIEVINVVWTWAGW
jgi:hypothetical protein